MSWIVAILMIAGAFFAFMAALGVSRLPDFYMRTHAATKAGAFGASLLLLAAAIHFGSLRAVITALLIIGFSTWRRRLPRRPWGKLHIARRSRYGTRPRATSSRMTRKSSWFAAISLNFLPACD